MGAGEGVREDLEGPPGYLLDMRLVYNGVPPRTPAQTKLKELWDGDSDKFLAKLHQMEKDYRAAKGRGPAGGPVVSEEADEPEPVELLIQELIDKAKQDPRDEEIAALKAEVVRLQGLTNGLADRVAGQSEILSRRAEKAAP